MSLELQNLALFRETAYQSDGKSLMGADSSVLFGVGRVAARRQLRAQRIADATQRRQGVQRPSQSFIAIGADVENEFVQEVLRSGQAAEVWPV